jgi:hypothetical protein
MNAIANERHQSAGHSGRAFRWALVASLLVILLSGCTTDVADSATPADPGAGCDYAFAQAIAIAPDSDTVDPVDGAVASCPSLEAWVKAATRYPDSIAGQDPLAYARSSCAASAQLARTPVCLELAQQPTR